MMLQGTLEKEKIGKIVELLKQSKSILFITGAGISADSGLPTYRGEGGLYNTTATDEGIPIETILAGEMIKTRPELVWKYLGQIEKRTRTAKFNRAHEVIAEMEKHFPHVLVFTQNIDGFHAQAGSKNVIDIHGDMHKVYCPKCFWSKKLDNYEQLSSSPTCPDCGAVIRPDIVFFGENLPEDKINRFFEELDRGFDIFFSIGTTSVFPYIRQPMALARHLGRPTIEINPDHTEISDWVDIKISLGAAEAMDAVWKSFSEEERIAT